MSVSDSLSMDFDLPHSPEKVWRALTDPVLLAEWLLPVFEFKLEAGAAFRFQTQAFPGWDGTVKCRFVEIEPGRKLKRCRTMLDRAGRIRRKQREARRGKLPRQLTEEQRSDAPRLVRPATGGIVRHLFSYTWSVPDMDTVVTFTIAPTNSGTRLSLVQSGFKPHHKREFGGARYGWKMMGEKLAALLGRLT